MDKKRLQICLLVTDIYHYPIIVKKKFRLLYKCYSWLYIYDWLYLSYWRDIMIYGIYINIDW